MVGSALIFFGILTSLHHNRWLRYRWPYTIFPGYAIHQQKRGCQGGVSICLAFGFREWNSVPLNSTVKSSWNHKPPLIPVFVGMPVFRASRIWMQPCRTMPPPFLRQHVWAQWWGRRWEMLWCWLWKTAKSLWTKNPDPVDAGMELNIIFPIRSEQRTTKIFDFSDVFWGVHSFSIMSTISSRSSLPDVSFQTWFTKRFSCLKWGYSPV